AAPVVSDFPWKRRETLAFHPPVLPRYARHHETGAAPTAAEAAALAAYERDSAAYNSTRCAASSLIDHALHRRATRRVWAAPGRAPAPRRAGRWPPPVWTRSRTASSRRARSLAARSART